MGGKQAQLYAQLLLCSALDPTFKTLVLVPNEERLQNALRWLEGMGFSTYGNLALYKNGAQVVVNTIGGLDEARSRM